MGYNKSQIECLIVNTLNIVSMEDILEALKNDGDGYKHTFIEDNNNHLC